MKTRLPQRQRQCEATRSCAYNDDLVGLHDVPL
jgi:hypothetical protein